MSRTENTKTSNPIRDFFAELVQRRVLQIGGIYIAGAWLGVEIFSFLFEQFQAPDWSYRLLAILLIVGFPISMVLAWVVQLQEDGTWIYDPSSGEHKTVLVAITLGVLIMVGLSMLIFQESQPQQVYKPIPNSLAIVPLVGSCEPSTNQGVADRLHLSLQEGLDQSNELTLVSLGRGEQPDDLPDFGKSLRVSWLANGRLTTSANAAHFELQLMDVKRGDITWSQTFDWGTAQIIGNGNTVANALLEAMSLPALPRDDFAGTAHVQAYESLLEGVRNAAVFTPEKLTEATGHYQQAIDIDPGYERAYTGLAQAIYGLLELTDLPEADRQSLETRARNAVDIAQRLSQESADAISLLGFEIENSLLRVQAYERALELEPDHYMSFYRYALQLKDDGKLELAERLIKRAIQLQPMNARFSQELVTIYQLQGREEDAQMEREKPEVLKPLEKLCR
jgi:tetratricopeptide (TPR) repeat protein